MYNNSFAQNIIMFPEGYDMDVFPLESKHKRFYTLHFESLKDAIEKGIEISTCKHDEVAVYVYGGDYVWHSTDNTDDILGTAIMNAAYQLVNCPWYTMRKVLGNERGGKRIRKTMRRNRVLRLKILQELKLYGLPF